MVALPLTMPAVVTSLPGKMITPGLDLREALKVEQVELPYLVERETLVEVMAVAVGSTDLACLRLQKKGTTPGFDIAGVVVRCSSGKWRRGDRVFGMVIGGLGSTLKSKYDKKRHENNGSFGTYARAHTDFLVRMPDEMSFEEASAVAFQSLVAFQAFNFPAWPIQVTDGEWILITGGSSIIGMSAIQIANLVGYRVITTCSSEHLKRCREYGAEVALDYTTPQVDQLIRATTNETLSLAIDAVSRGNSTTTAYKSLGPNGGTISTVLPREERAKLIPVPPIVSTRAKISIEMKIPTTLFGYRAEWQGEQYYPSPGEHHRAQRFLASLETWIEEGKWETLPITVAKEKGVEGVIAAMESVRHRGSSGTTLVCSIGGDPKKKKEKKKD